ncbi:MAG: DoxX family protein [Bacteroidales bacterium]|nr:DoxX family protein [Bacteroidales bacterium]HPD95296.1 DoxX family protein [Tenuifilaceae bacterium]HRX30558.1 DoxX family protein [Tenuifilaceae bacterium]
MKKLLVFCRYLLAVVFIFSGFVKGVDPLGSAYKFHDYFMAFHMEFLLPLTLTFSIIQSAIELFAGLLLLFNVLPRFATWVTFLFMVVFTPLTLGLAIFNPVSDCGCFGDAIHLSNWQTFFKNLVFFTAALLLFLKRGDLKASHSGVKQLFLFVVLLFISVVPIYHGYNHLPLFDFRPYHVGVNMYQSMIIPDNAPADEYKTILYYQKDGKEKKFDETNYPWNDSTWTFVNSESILVKRGYEAPIHNFSLTTVDGLDVTDSLTQTKGYSFLVVSPWLSKVSDKAISELANVYKYSQEKGYKFFWATASSTDEIANVTGKTGIPFPFVQADEVTLKTIVRANPGLLLVYDGTIVGKWHWKDIPNFRNKPDLLSASVMQLQHCSNARMSYLLIVSLLLLLVVVCKWK